ncbi:MAG TPA: secretin N-terminal domain-containing protein [Gemmataceae bacterium]|nr:secretin N-terminal domain-containing protein [Gemmataceae bacterium]
MKCSARLAVAVAILCVVGWHSYWCFQASAKQPAPETPPLQLAKSVPIDDLFNGKLAKNERVILTYQLLAMQADVFAPSVKKMMSPNGQVIPVQEANKLILIDSVENLSEIVKTIKKIEMDDPSGRVNAYTYNAKYVRAAAAAEKLKMILDNPNAYAANGIAQPEAKGARPIKPHTVDYDDRTNMVIVIGPPDKVNLAKQVLAKLDVLDKQAQQGHRERLMLKTYLVPAGAESIAKMLQQIYKSSSSMRIEPVGTTQIMVYALVADQMAIANLLNGALPPQGVAGVSPNQVEALRLLIESLSGEKTKAPQGK